MSKGQKWKEKTIMCDSGDNDEKSDEELFGLQHNLSWESSIRANNESITSNNDVEDLAANMEKAKMFQKSSQDRTLTDGGSKLVEILVINESLGAIRGKN